MRLLVQEPMNTRSERQRLHRLAGLEAHVFERLGGGFALVVGFELGRIGHAARRPAQPGRDWCPSVICGAMSAAL